MNISNCLKYRRLAEVYNDNGLLEATTNFFGRNFEAVSKSSDFVDFMTLQDFADFLKSQAVTIKDENVILQVSYCNDLNEI